MRSWFSDNNKPSLVERLCINVLRCGPIPRHVAFIMDGNRRYARKTSVETIDGHKEGFDRMAQTLEWCLELGVDEVTVYAFAIDNFKRPASEVNKLMDFARDMFQKLLDERHKLMDTGKCVRVIGDLSLLAPDIQQLVAEIVLLTKDNRHKVLNICFPYASRHEMTEALQELQTCVRNGLIRESDINESLISKFLYTSQSSDPDLLVRTSGETRLSDFLLWQTSFSVIAFADVLWPEFTIWDLFSAILYYQRNCGSVKNAKQLYESRLNDIEESADDTIDDRLDATRSTRSQRIADCLLYLEDKRLNQLKCMCNKGVKVDT